MSDLVKRLRDFAKPMKEGVNVIVAGPLITDEAAALIESQDKRIKALEAENAKLRRAIGQPSGSGRVVVSPLAHLSQEEQDAASKRHAAALMEEKK